jgi:transcription elongation factor SPT6
VREEGKENAFSLGQSLWIGKLQMFLKSEQRTFRMYCVTDNLEFEDLDEIIARHVAPMAAFVRDVLAFKYTREFDGGKRDKAEAAILEEREKNKNKIHYFLSPSKVNIIKNND